MGDLIPLPNNSRHGDIPALAESLARFGQRKPIVIDAANVIIAGNHIFQAAVLLDATEIAAAGAGDLSAEDRRAYILADNRLSELGGYDVELLASQLADAAEDAAGLLGTGFDPDDVDAVLASLTEPDDASWLVAFERTAGVDAHAQRNISFSLPVDDAALLLAALAQAGGTKNEAVIIIARAFVADG